MDIEVVMHGCSHDEESTVGGGCDDQFEFEFALGLLLDGFDRLHRQGWSSGRQGAGHPTGTTRPGGDALLTDENGHSDGSGGR